MRTKTVPSAQDTDVSFYRRLIIAFLLFNLCIYALAAFSLSINWRHYEKQAENTTENVAKILEDTISGIMGRSAIALLSVVDEAERSLAVGEIEKESFDRFIERQADRVPELDMIRVTNSQGDVLFGNELDPTLQTNAADREYFQYVRDNPQAGLYISKPFIGRVSNRWVFSLSHRINNADGSFAGVAFGIFPIEFFTALFADLNIGDDYIIDLRDETLAVVARYPEPDGLGSSIGQIDSLQSFVDLVQAGKPNATFAGRSQIDNIYRIYSYRKMVDLPFYIRVGLGNNTILRDFTKDLFAVLGLSVFFTVVTFWFARQLVGAWRGEQQATRALRMANHDLEIRVAERTVALHSSNTQLQIEIAEHKELQASLRQSEAKYRSLFDNAPIGIIVTVGGRVLLCNKQESALFGYNNPDELIGRPIVEMIHPDDVSTIVELGQRIRHGETAMTDSVCFRGRRTDGETLVIEAISVQFPFAEETALISFHQNVTEQQRVTTALQESERRYRRLAENVVDVIWTLDFDFHFTDISPSVIRLLGLSPEEAMQSSLTDNFPPASQQKIFELIAQFDYPEGIKSLPKDWSYTVELENFHKDGTLFPIEVKLSLMYDEQEQPIGILGVTRDIRERKRAEAAIRAAEQRFRDLVDSTDGIVWEADASTFVFTSISANAERLLGYPLSDWLQPGFWASHIHPEDQESAVRYCVECTGRLQHHDFEYRFMAQDGRMVWLRDIVKVVAENGQPRWLRGLMVDITAAKKLQNALQYSEQQLKSYIEHAGDAIYVVDQVSGRILSCNEKACQDLGYSQEELLQLSARDIEAHFDPEEIVRIHRSLDSHPKLRIEGMHRRKDGRAFPVEITLSRLDSVEPPSMLSIVRDISQRKRAEESLQQSEATLRLLIDATLDSILLLEADGTVVIGNKTVADRLGQTLETMIGRNALELLPENIVQSRYNHMQHVLHTGEPARFEDERHGRWVDNSIYPVFNSQGQIFRLAVFGRDITENKQAEERLRLSEERLSLAMRAGNLGLYDLNVQTGVAIVNAEYATMLGYAPDEFHETNAAWLERLHPDDHDRVAQTYQDYQAGRTPEYRVEFRQRTKSGEWKWILSVGRLVEWDAAGRPLRMLGIHLDITERMQAETALMEAKLAAEAANRAKGEFLANMSHELRTPLNAILGFSALMAQDKGLSATYQENLAVIKRSGEYLLGLINDVLDMAKIEAGRVTVQENSFDLRQMIGDLIALFQMRAADKGLALHVAVHPDIPYWICTDEGKLRQVLINLVSNALKFTTTGGIDLSVRLAERGDDRRLLFAVADTGCGIADEDMSAVFEPFVQKANVYGMQEGTGLGLPISRRFVRLLGGELTVSSSGIPGEGSIFQFDIPLLPCEDCKANNFQQIAPHPHKTSPVRMQATPAVALAEPQISLADLPERWVSQLRQAASTAQAARILALGEQIKEKQPALAAALQQWVDEFNYDAILDAIPSAKEKGNE